MSSDHLTILTTTGLDQWKVVSKVWFMAHAGRPVCDQFGDKPQSFAVSQVQVFDFWTLEEELTHLVDCPNSMLLRGEPLPGIDLKCTHRLFNPKPDGRQPTIRDKARHWLALDFDTYVPRNFDPIDGETGANYYRSVLPDPFRAASCWWLLSASAGIKPECRMRLAFWLNRPIDCRQLGLLFAATETDHGMFNPIQGQGVAAPIFRNMRDPIAERCGILEGDVDTVQVPEIAEPPKPDRAKAKRQLEEFRTRYGNDWPIATLTEVASKIQTTPMASMNAWGGGGRHHALFCGALRVSGLVDKGFLPEGESRHILAAAAKSAGISDTEANRTIANAFRQGGL